MKKSLLVWSVLGMSIVQSHAVVQETFEAPNQQFSQSLAAPPTLTRQSATFSNFSTNQHINLVESLGALTMQSARQDDRLSLLADSLTTEQIAQPTTSFATSNNTLYRSSRLSSTAPPAIAAAKAARAAHAKTIGLCARYVRKALQAAGYSFTPNPSAYQYATRGTLAKAGFTKISNDSPPQVGDVVVYNRTAKYRHGHIQIFDGSRWVSDFIQPDKTPYSDNFSYTTWRDSRYLNDASNAGMYLAMED